MAGYVSGIQSAEATPFEPNRNPDFNGGPSGLNAENCQDAIEELKGYIGGIARFCVPAGFDGTASTGRWFEFITNVASNVSPFVSAKTAVIKELTLIAQANATTNIRIFKNGVQITNIALAASRKAVVTGLNLSVAALDEISIQTTSGSSAKPMVYIFMVYV